MNFYVKVKKDIKIFVEETYADPNNISKHVILFIHGWPLNHNMWEYQVEYLTKLGYRCITLDLRGYGKSDRPYYGYDYDTMASDIKAVIDTLKLKNITLVGHSMGAAIAIRYMLNYQGYEVSKLCLLSSAAPSFIRTKDWPNGLTNEQIIKLMEFVFSDRPRAIPLIRDMSFYRYITPTTANWFDLICLDSSLWGTGESLIALRSEKLFDNLDKIKVPTLIIHSIHDEICPFQCANYLKEHISNSILLPLSESGYAAFFEEKKKISDAINRFIQGSLKITDMDSESGSIEEKHSLL
ncbi:alpha/beta fold hydrolase [Turicibacter sanguinis]|uniref:alpha/beta fold hydrolase n=1 Tax=Turicibacter sanguinis TaxID=154288 RepID=UPI0018AA4725|nr:alpha/beta hydrolase [Turicibacter sanguinis]MDB8553557.1 alpha/beta hydrolase [Turicibacter sanguinis]